MRLEDVLIAQEVAKNLLIDRARKKLLAFTLYTYPEYEVSWHHDVTCQYLDKFISGEIKRLMIFEPPRHGKSELTSRRLPALLHGMFPNDEILAASYNSELASDMTIDVQRIMDRPEYKILFPNSRITPEGSMSKYARSRNEHELIPIQHPDKYWFFPKGSYRSAGVGGSFTGRGGNWVLIDDPVKNRQDADSPAFRNELWKFYSSTLRTRLEKDARILVTMTRWHADDLAGRLINLAKTNPKADQWVILNLPAFRENDPNQYDPREIDEALWPNKFDAMALDSTKESIGSREFTALYQQRPTAEGGNIIKAEQIRYYGGRDQPQLPTRFDQQIQSWDFATKDKTSSDFAVGTIWGRVGANKYLLPTEYRGRWSFPVACKKVIEASLSYPGAYKKIVEAKANGPAIIQTLKDTVPGLVECEPYGDKVSRVNAVSVDFESGNVWFPDPSIAPWIIDFVQELTDFPNGTNDDRVDSTSQALQILQKARPVHAPLAGHSGSR